MIGEIIVEVGRGITASFGFISAIFEGIGLPWLAFVLGLVALSVLLRLYATAFIGDRGDAEKDVASKTKNKKKGD